MKKVLSIVMTAVIAFSLIGCTSSSNSLENDNNTGNQVETKSDNNAEQNEADGEEYNSFAQYLDSFANKDNYYSDPATLKIEDKDKLKQCEEKSKDVVSKVMKDNNIDPSKAKVYPYYKNDNGQRSEREYIVVYDDGKIAHTVYEVGLKVSDAYDVTFEDCKELKDKVDDKFKELFKGEFK